MRLSDLIDEASRVPKQGMGVKTFISPDTLNMLALKRQYDKEVAQVKANAPPKPTVKKDSISVYHVDIPVEYVENWRKTRDVEWALQKARKWRTSGLPKEVIDSLSKDPLWQKLVIGVWDLGIKYLEARKKLTGDKGDRHRWGGTAGIVANLADVGVDTSLPRLVFRKIDSLVAQHAGKFGLDRTGRQLPGISKLTREEQLDEKKKKPKPTSPEKWAKAKAKARSKFEVYPSAYANAWAAKEYKKMGGGWRMGE